MPWWPDLCRNYWVITAYAGTEQSMIGLDDGTEPPPGIVEKTFVYNAANRMASVSDGGVLTMSYRYNGAGERVYRTGSGKTVHTVFDTAGHWIGDYDEYGQPLQQAIWLGDLPVGLVARIDGLDRLFYVEPDALGSPRVVIDPTRDAANGGTAVRRCGGVALAADGRCVRRGSAVRGS